MPPLTFKKETKETYIIFFVMEWMNIGATVLLVVLGIAIYVSKRKDAA